MLITIVELHEYIKRAEKILSKDERDELLFYLSSNPKAGTLMQGTGGVRKLRLASKGKGKSGGSRVIYFFYNDTIPLFLLTIFGKSEKTNINKTERNQLAKLVKELLTNYKR